MYHIKTFNKISPAGLERFDGERYTVGSEVTEEDGIVVRSAPLLDYSFPESLLAIARAVTISPWTAARRRGLPCFPPPGPMPMR